MPSIVPSDGEIIGSKVAGEYIGLKRCHIRVGRISARNMALDRPNKGGADGTEGTKDLTKRPSQNRDIYRFVSGLSSSKRGRIRACDRER